MKLRIFIFLILVPASISSEWELIYTAPSSISCFTANDSCVLTGTGSDGVYLSSNNGQSWLHGQNLTYGWVLSLTANGPIIFAGLASNSGVYISTNNGLFWTQTSLDSLSIVSLTISNSTVFAAIYNGILFSNDNGQNWNYHNINNLNVTALTSNDYGIFAGTSWGVYYSSDLGQTWAVTALDSIDILEIAACDSNIIAGTAINGIFVSTNNGINWSQTSINTQYIFSIAALRTNIFAGTYAQGVYLSKDNGLNWGQINEGLGNLNVVGLQIFQEYIYAATYGGHIYKRHLSEIIGLHKIVTELPKEYSLSQNYPNPFNPVTKIRFEVPPVGKRHSFQLQLVVYDILGREVQTLANDQLSPGTYEVEWDGTNYPSGVYYYTLTAGEFKETKRMVLIK